jgi:hypothetical protein
VLTITQLGVDTIELFPQWLLTGSYHEYTGFARAPLHPAFNENLSPLPEESTDTLVWCVKAAVLAWKLGQHLEAPKFQNHAMRRLFAASSVMHPGSRLLAISYGGRAMVVRKSTSSLKISSFATGETTR